MATKRLLKIKPIYIILVFLLAFCIMGGIYLSQQTKMDSIEEEKAELQAELDAYKVEQERLESMLEYMQTDAYLEQYAREKLGYVYPNDTKFYE